MSIQNNCYPLYPARSGRSAAPLARTGSSAAPVVAQSTAPQTVSPASTLSSTLSAMSVINKVVDFFKKAWSSITSLFSNLFPKPAS